ncbi:hypothetical protein [Asticcacaulis benevestitus]|uniref:Restriction endonuclease type IV Mrr domain-containing protein n=1 Tax=Asticcacaulis benevestitus DSM 16100 = ATCC BAA-896 TaxID=1121022 RepID=V4PNE0_9CAUL|nr:hypothetical protein [Asticcacaulis benevestitus]ESQ89766.1 hypothetical protein ABENE_13570 [Asticcacaulis benevestitus DSM 16100 = ATCC BAA-896]
MEENRSPELELVTELASLLRKHGDVSVEYVTAEMQPFTNQFKPDILFSPTLGGYSRQKIFIEIKLKLKNMGVFIKTLPAHKEFAEEYMEIPITKYVFATSIGIDELTSKRLENIGITALTGISTAKEIFDSLEKLNFLR